MVQLYLALIDDEDDKIRFEEAYYEYQTLMHFVATEILHDGHRAEDAVQEAFIRIAKNFHTEEDVEAVIRYLLDLNIIKFRNEKELAVVVKLWMDYNEEVVDY